MGIFLGIVLFLLFAGSFALSGYACFKDSKLKEEKRDLVRYEKPTDEIVKKIKKNDRNIVVSAIASLVLLIAFIIVPFSFHQINTGEVAVVKVWGKAEYTKAEGTHFDFWLGKKYEKYDTKIRQAESETMAYSQDAQTMNLKLTVQYRIQADKVLNINKEFGSLEVLESRIKSIVEEKTKATMSSMQAMKIIEERESLSAKVIEGVASATTSYYVEITNVLITNIDFSDAFEQAVENKMISEQQQLQSEYEAKKAEIEAQGRLKVAMLEAEAELEKAKKEAESMEVKAEAEAKALEIVQKAWYAVPEEVRDIMLQEMAIENWDGKLPETMVGTEFLEWLMGALNTPTTP